jgi:hypothetical protein
MVKTRAMILILLGVLLIGLCGCANNRTFSGSKTGNDEQFLVDFDFLNTTVEHQITLEEDDIIRTTINIKGGRVDILVKNENGKVAYRGDDAESSEFNIIISEAGVYTFSIKGYKAEGNVYFYKK